MINISSLLAKLPREIQRVGEILFKKLEVGEETLKLVEALRFAHKALASDDGVM